MRCKCKIAACHERERSMKLNFTKSLKRLSLLTSLAAALPPLPSPLWLPPAARISISCFQAHMWVCRGCCVCMSNCRVEGGWGKTSPVNFFFVSPPFPLGATQRASTAATPASPFLFLASFQITSHNRLPLQGERGEWGVGGWEVDTISPQQWKFNLKMERRWREQRQRPRASHPVVPPSRRWRRQTSRCSERTCGPLRGSRGLTSPLITWRGCLRNPLWWTW